MPPLDEAEIFAPSASADMPHDLDLAQLRPLKLVTNVGNGAAGHVIDALEKRFKVLGENTLQKLNRDGSLSKLICTRVSSGN